MKPKVGDIVMVVWVDAQLRNEWEPPDTNGLRPPTATTYGKLIHAEKSYVAVAHEVFVDGSCRQITSIPRNMIIETRRLS